MRGDGKRQVIVILSEAKDLSRGSWTWRSRSFGRFTPQDDTADFSPLSSDFSLLTSHLPPLTSHFSLLTSHFSPLTSHLSLLTSHLSLLTSHFSPLPFSLLTSHFSLLPSHFSPLTSHLSLPYTGTSPSRYVYPSKPATKSAINRLASCLVRSFALLTFRRNAASRSVA